MNLIKKYKKIQNKSILLSNLKNYIKNLFLIYCKNNSYLIERI